MRPKHLLAILVLLMLALPAAPIHAGGVVSVCDEAHLLAALAGGGTVTFACSGTIILTAEIAIAADTTIDGSGQTVTISGNNAVRVFTVNPGVALNLNTLTIANGNFAGHGGGIRNYGVVSVNNSTFSGHTGRGGGAIYNDYDGTLAVSNSTFSGNSGLSGGGFLNYGLATVSNSTFSGNSVVGGGGGICNGSNGTVEVSNSTFSGNSAGLGGGIYNSSTLTIKNTIVTNSISGANCGGALIDGGGNLSYPDTTCPGTNGDPMLGPLQNDGGPTHTMALGPGSAAIDAGTDAICAAAPVNNLDQRGVVRPLGSHCDVGAVEQQPYPSLPSRMWLPAVRAR